MKLSLVVLAMAMCLGSVLANDLQVGIKVYGCNGEVLPDVTVRVSGCVDDGLMGPGSIGITAKTNSSGIAFFKQHAENSIQYCWGSAEKKCKIEVVGGASVDVLTYSTLGLTYNSQLVSPREYLCQALGCCNPCNHQEASCTDFIYYGMLEFRPTAGCRPSCCAESCTVLARVGRNDVPISGTCSSRFAELGSSPLPQVPRRRALLQSDVSSELLSVLPQGGIILKDDGTPMFGNSTAESGGRRLLTNAVNPCPSGWINSNRDCAVGGCGKCCVRMQDD